MRYFLFHSKKFQKKNLSIQNDIIPSSFIILIFKEIYVYVFFLHFIIISYILLSLSPILPSKRSIIIGTAFVQ